MLGFSKLIRTWATAGFQTGVIGTTGVCADSNELSTRFKHFKKPNGHHIFIYNTAAHAKFKKQVSFTWSEIVLSRNDSLNYPVLSQRFHLFSQF